MERILEPELMNDEQQALAYASADFEEPHNHFIELLISRVGGSLPANGLAIDLGCGAADISIRFAHAFPDYSIDACDGAKAMLAEGRRAIEKNHLNARINLIETLIDETTLENGHVDIIFSNSLLHHLHQPMQLWHCINNTVGNPDVFIMDLMRPDSDQQVDDLVKEYAYGEPEILQRDFRNSLKAAFTEEEVKQQLAEAGLSKLSVEVISDRHFIVYGKV